MKTIQFREPIVQGRYSKNNLRGPVGLMKGLLTGEIAHGNYTVRFARSFREVESAIKLQNEVFNLGTDHDLNLNGPKCLYLIVLENDSETIVGTYRISTLETVKTADRFYSSQVFDLNDLPRHVLERAIEISRLCILREHRNKQVLFLLWKGLANHLLTTKKRYLFGCCSIFSQDYQDAVSAHEIFRSGGVMHKDFSVSVASECMFSESEKEQTVSEKWGFELPKLFGTYLKIGAKICSEPAIDRGFKTIDFFMLFDLNTISERHFKLFFG